jgi:hypothetical protein
MKQTAVEWLEFEINRRGPKKDNPPQWLKELYEQAKEMEEQQKKDAWEDGMRSDNGFFGTFEQYYNKIYGGNK